MMIPQTTTNLREATRVQHATALALGLSDAEEALERYTAGQVDAVVDSSGRTYMLRAAQDGLRHKEKQLRTILDCSADIITLVNRGGTIISQSLAASRILGYNAGELHGTSIFTYIHGLDLASLFSTFLNVIEGFHESGTARFRHRRRDGAYRSLEATLRKMDGAHSSEVVFTLRPVREESDSSEGTFTEAKEPKPWQPKIEIHGGGTGSHLRSFESFPDFIVINGHCCVQRQSSTLPRLLGIEPEVLVGRCLLDFIHPDDVASLKAQLAEALQHGRPTTFDSKFRYSMEDGTWQVMEVTIGTLQPVASTEILIIFRERNATRQRIASEAREAKLAKASLAKDKFLAMLSHELRTPLNPVLLCLGELEEEDKFAEARPIFAMMRRNILAQTRLLEELSYFTTLDQHKVRLHLEPIGLREAIRLVIEICRSDIAAAGILIRLELQARDDVVQADSVRLQQVLWNLLKNAIKFSPRGGTIAISTANDLPDRVTISVTDHGIGIQPDFLPLVFDPFQQGEESIRPSYGGLGLGMYIAKGLAEAQQADLTVESAGEGQGTTFRLSFQTLKQTPRMDPLPVPTNPEGESI